MRPELHWLLEFLFSVYLHFPGASCSGRGRVNGSCGKWGSVHRERQALMEVAERSAGH